MSLAPRNKQTSVNRAEHKLCSNSTQETSSEATVHAQTHTHTHTTSGYITVKSDTSHRKQNILLVSNTSPPKPITESVIPETTNGFRGYLGNSSIIFPLQLQSIKINNDSSFQNMFYTSNKKHTSKIRTRNIQSTNTIMLSENKLFSGWDWTELDAQAAQLLWPLSRHSSPNFWP